MRDPVKLPAPTLSFEEISVTFGSGHHAHQALRSVTFDLEPSERVGVIGASGSGKSTLVNVALGLIRPTGGSYRYEGVELGDSKVDRHHPLRQSVAAIFQDPLSSLDPTKTIGRSLMEPLVSLRRGGDHWDLALSAVQEVGLDPSLLSRYPNSLSGGQAQRVCIARALITKPALLIGDEPVSALDIETKLEVIRVLSQAIGTRGLAMVLVSHDISTVRLLCQRTLVMSDGEIVEDRPTAELFADPHHRVTKSLLARRSLRQS